MTDFERARGTALDELARALALVREAEIEELARLVESARALFIAGAGRSGLAARAWAMRLMQLGLRVHVVGEVTTPAIGARDLLVAVSGSGRTAGVLEVARAAIRAGAKVACVTTAADSELARLSGCCVLIPVSTPKADGRSEGVASRQPLASLFEQSVWLLGDIHAAVLRDRLGVGERDMMARHANLE